MLAYKLPKKIIEKNANKQENARMPMRDEEHGVREDGGCYLLTWFGFRLPQLTAITNINIFVCQTNKKNKRFSFLLKGLQ